MLLETGSWFTEVITMQRVYKYITDIKNKPNHRLPKQAWTINCKIQKTNKSKILSSGWMPDILRWFKRWSEDLLEL